jgi:UDP-glucose 4-epimerase
MNVSHLEGREHFRLIIDSVLNDSLIEQLIRESDRVYHMASAVGVKLIMEQPVKTIETIFGGTDVVLRHCSRFRKRVLIPSTSEVYGKGVSVPFHEDDDVLTGATSKHRWAYACAKSLDEFLALAHYKETRLPVVVIRLFNTVGPRQTGQYGMVVPRFVQSALKNEDLIVHGDGQQTRCFAHVADVVAALPALMALPEARGRIFNLGSDTPVSIGELARAVARLVDPALGVEHISYDQAYPAGFEEIACRVPDLTRIQQTIGYAPRHTLDDVLRDVVESFRRR